jgi:hypothetical protein
MVPPATRLRRNPREGIVTSLSDVRGVVRPVVAARDDRVVRAILVVFAVYFVGIALLALVSPHTFFEKVGPFGSSNAHYIRDGATFELAHPKWLGPFDFGGLALGTVVLAWALARARRHEVRR